MNFNFKTIGNKNSSAHELLSRKYAIFFYVSRPKMTSRVLFGSKMTYIPRILIFFKLAKNTYRGGSGVRSKSASIEKKIAPCYFSPRKPSRYRFSAALKRKKIWHIFSIKVRAHSSSYNQLF